MRTMNKKGFVQVLGLLLASPYILLGAGVFVLLVLLGFYFALGKLIGAMLIVIGALLSWRLNWKIGLPLVAVGFLAFYNPFNAEWLQMVPFGG